MSVELSGKPDAWKLARPVWGWGRGGTPRPTPLVDNQGTAYATVNGGSTFATVSGGQIVGLTTYSSTNSFISASSQTLITSSTSAGGTTGVVTFSSSSTALTLTGSNDIDAGGILVTPAATGTVITGGSLHAGGGNGVVIINYGSLNVASAIIDNAAGATLTVCGPGITTLSGANTYTGATWINNGSTLRVGNGGNSGTLGSGNVANSGTLIFSRSDAGLTVAAVINGNGSLLQNGNGMVTLTGSNTYTGGTTIFAGTLQVGNGGIGATIGSTSSLFDNGGLVFNHSDAVTFSLAIGGSGGLMQTGTGILTLTGSNTYSGGTTISAGTLQVNGTGTLGAGAVTDNSALVFNLSGATTFGGVISGVGSLTQAGTGRLVLTGSNTYAGGTLVSAGTLVLAANGALPSGSGLTVGANGTVIFSPAAAPFSGLATWTSSSGSAWNNAANWVDNNNVPGVPGIAPRPDNTDTAAFSGSGSVTTIDLTGANPSLKALNFSTSSYTLSGGSLTLKSGSGMATVTVSGTQSIGSLLSLASSADVVVSNSADRLTISGQIVGGSPLLKAGAGMLILSGSDNTYSGGTLVAAGTLDVMNSDALPGGSGLTVGAGGTVIFNPAPAGAPMVATRLLAASPAGEVVVAVPEPGTLGLLAAALWSAAIYRRFRCRCKGGVRYGHTEK